MFPRSIYAIRFADISAKERRNLWAEQDVAVGAQHLRRTEGLH